MRSALLLALLALTAVGPLGCATNETDPARVSAWDLTFGKSRLERHVDRGRSIASDRERTERALEVSLQRLTQKVNALDARLQQALGRLAQARHRNDNLYRQLLARKSDLEEEQRTLYRLNQKLDRVPSQQLVDEVLAVEERVANLNDTIADLLEFDDRYERDTR